MSPVGPTYRGPRGFTMYTQVTIASPMDEDAALAGLAGEQASQSDLYLRLCCGDEPHPLLGLGSSDR